MRARILGAVESKLPHDRTALKAHKIILKIEPALIRSQSGAHGIICRRQHTGTDAESAAEVGGDGRETLAPPQPNCALDMNRQVAIAIRNQSSPPSAVSVSMNDQVSSRRPHPSFVLSRPASVYINVSTSGETCRPRCSKSSPTLATTSRLSPGTIRLRPSASLAPPMPPDRATTRSRLIETDPHLRNE